MLSSVNEVDSEPSNCAMVWLLMVGRITLVSGSPSTHVLYKSKNAAQIDRQTIR